MPDGRADDGGRASAGVKTFSPEATAALTNLGINESQLESLAEGKSVAFALSGAADGTVAIAQLTAASRLRVGIYTIRNIGGGLGDFLIFESKSLAAAKALSVRELELLGIEVTNPKLKSALEKGRYTPTNIPVPDELGGGEFAAISLVRSPN